MRTPEPIPNASDSTISVGELRERLSDPRLTIVDVRDLPAYNGWRLGGTARGGHIPGAVAFPGAWLKSVDDLEVERLLRSKGILASREVALYGDRRADTGALKTRLAELGHAGVRIYQGSWAEWAADRTLPVERLANHEKLVHAEWLRELLDGGRPEAAPAGRFRLFHVNFGVPEEYEENHIPGALYLDTTIGSRPVTRWRRSSVSQCRSRPSAPGSRSARTSSSTSTTSSRSYPTRSMPPSSASAPGRSTSARSADTTTLSQPVGLPAIS